jgi:hypothetical protein
MEKYVNPAIIQIRTGISSVKSYVKKNLTKDRFKLK